VLCAVARRLQAGTRPGDLVARLAGDEFVLVVATSDAGAVAAVVERIEQAMAEPVVLIDGRRVPVSISLGVADLEPGLSPADRLAAADAAMYVAKRDRATGRLSELA